MRTVSLATLRTFIKVQKNSRAVDCFNGSDCILAHYCKSQKIKFTHCGFSHVRHENKTILEVAGNKWIPQLFKQALPYGKVTYGKLKKLMF